MALDATVGGASANSYLTLAAANALFAARVGSSTWSAATDEEKSAALQQATRELDLDITAGCKADSAQRLAFPRADQDEPLSEIPADVQWGCAEQAIWVLAHAASGGVSSRQELQAEGVVAFSVGGLSETFGARSGGDSALCARARSYLRGWKSRGGNLIGPREIAGRRRWTPLGYL